MVPQIFCLNLKVGVLFCFPVPTNGGEGAWASKTLLNICLGLMRCNLRCAVVAASISAMRGGESLLNFYASRELSILNWDWQITADVTFVGMHEFFIAIFKSKPSLCIEYKLKCCRRTNNIVREICFRKVKACVDNTFNVLPLLHTTDFNLPKIIL